MYRVSNCKVLSRGDFGFVYERVLTGKAYPLRDPSLVESSESINFTLRVCHSPRGRKPSSQCLTIVRDTPRYCVPYDGSLSSSDVEHSNVPALGLSNTHLQYEGFEPTYEPGDNRVVDLGPPVSAVYDSYAHVLTI